MDLRNRPEMMHMISVAQGPNQRFALMLYFLFKILLILVSGMAIYLGYRLFILGVTGSASISVNSKDIGGQLLNAAPGLFFAVGGIISLIFIVIKGVEVKA